MTEIASVYSQGLYSLAKEEGLEKSVLEELCILQESFRRDPEFLKLLAAHQLSKEERCRILDESFRERLQPYILNFLKILTEKGYIRYFSDCCDAYRSQYNADHGILVVKAASAVPMTDGQKQKLTEKLAAITGKQIDLQCRVEAGLLGGLRLDYDGRQVDGSVKNRLDNVSKLLKNTVLG